MKLDKLSYIRDIRGEEDNTIENTVIKCIYEIIEVLDENITMKTRLSDLSMNSLTFVSVIVKLEEEFGIEFDDIYLNLDNLENIGQLVDIIKNNLLKI